MYLAPTIAQPGVLTAVVLVNKFVHLKAETFLYGQQKHYVYTLYSIHYSGVSELFLIKASFPKFIQQVADC